jgi:hypothetical protein
LRDPPDLLALCGVAQWLAFVIQDGGVAVMPRVIEICGLIALSVLPVDSGQPTDGFR